MSDIEPALILLLFFIIQLFICFGLRLMLRKTLNIWEAKQLRTFDSGTGISRPRRDPDSIDQNRAHYNVENIIEIMRQQSQSVTTNQIVQAEIARNTIDSVGIHATSICDVVIYSTTAKQEIEDLPPKYEQCVRITENV